MMHLMISIFKMNLSSRILPNLKKKKSIYIYTLLKHSHTMQGNLRLLYTFSMYPPEAGLGISERLREALETNTTNST